MNLHACFTAFMHVLILSSLYCPTPDMEKCLLTHIKHARRCGQQTVALSLNDAKPLKLSAVPSPETNKALLNMATSAVCNHSISCLRMCVHTCHAWACASAYHMCTCTLVQLCASGRPILRNRCMHAHLLQNTQSQTKTQVKTHTGSK